MALHDNEAIVRTLADAFNSRKLDKSASVLSDELEWTDFATQTRFTGKDGYRRFDEVWLTAFPDGKMEITNCMVSDNQAVVEYTGRGTQTGPLVGPNSRIDPTGKTVELHLCDVMEIKDGKVVRGRTYYDLATLLSQLGQSTVAAAA